MSASLDTDPVTSFKIVKETSIAAPIDIVFQALLDELGPESQMPDGKPFPMKIEPWPGGRWFRDLGNNTGHLWGHVQVIKPPALVEICGPMPMSYPAINHVQYRLTAQGAGTLLKFTHQAMGLINPDHRDHMPEGWEFKLGHIRQLAESRAAKKH
ncbi:MAG TPA: SRPBCC domain-containing protein [Tepidisphaeraceae bacterium]|nr:SRPBCC domain-containing protein [Tepidisphaeraceae bacterium]